MQRRNKAGLIVINTTEKITGCPEGVVVLLRLHEDTFYAETYVSGGGEGK